ncbi:MAG: hypothetical protein KAI24_00970 [Planctomycetes bacterium]|nr:hypothetical protein [Planctomycetota bacterium]
MPNHLKSIVGPLFVLVCVASPGAQGPAGSLRSGGAREADPAIATRGRPAELAERADGALVVEAQEYSATFRGADASIAVRVDQDAGRAARLSLRLVGWSRGGGLHGPGVDAAARRDGGRVSIDHDSVVERYDVHERDIEQSFCFERRPTGSGDLQLHVDVGGNVHADACAPEHRAIEFRHEGAPAIRYGEAFALDRGGRRLRIATGYDGRGRLTLTVPAAFVDAARYPLLIDPAVGPVFVPAGGVFADQSPDAAHDPDGRCYLIVWERVFSGSDVQIRGRIHDDEGNSVSPLLLITTSGINRRPSVAWLSDENAYVVAWEEAGRIRMRLLDDVTGAPVSTPTWASSPPAGAYDRRPDVADAGGRGCVIVWDRTDPGLNEPNRIMVRAPKWASSVTLMAAEQSLHSISGSNGYVRAPRLPHTGWRFPVNFSHEHFYFVVWERFWTTPAPGDTDVWFATFRTESAVGPFATLLTLSGPGAVAGASDIGPDEITPSVGVVSSYSLIAWDDDGDILASYYNNYNTLSVNGPFAIRATPAIQSMPAVGGGWCDFTVGYAEADPATPFQKNILAARVKGNGTVTVVDRPIDILNGPNQGGLRAAPTPRNGASQDRTSTTLLVWWGETGSGNGARDVRARRFEPVAPTLYPFGSACTGPGGTLPQIGTANGRPVPGNDSFRFTIDNAPPSSIAFLMTSDTLTTTPIPGAPGCELYAGLPLISATPALVTNSGSGSLIVPIPTCVPTGSTLAFQWAVLTPGWNALGAIVSDDLDITWSQ